MSEILKDGLIAVTWTIMGLVVGFDLGRVFERSVRASARTRSVNDDATEPVPGDASALAPGAEPSPNADAQSDSQRKDCAGDGNVGFGAHADIVP